MRAYDGFIPPNFQQQSVFTFEQFLAGITKRSNQLRLVRLQTFDLEIAD